MYKRQIYDRESHIRLRLLSWEENSYPDDSWWARTIRESVLRRKNFFEDKAGQTTVFRLIHGEADMLPGVAADVYGKIIRVIISSRAAWNKRTLLAQTLETLLHPQIVIINTDTSFCAIEHLHEVTEYYAKGEKFIPEGKLEDIRIRESGIYYSVRSSSSSE